LSWKPYSYLPLLKKYSENVAPLLKGLKILNIKDLRYLKTASLMWDLENLNLPLSLITYFIKSNFIWG
jgi:hypothetical protein